MSGEPQGLVSYPGVVQLLSASVSFAHGISPGAARLSIAPQAALPSEYGTLAITFGSVAISLPNCRLDYGSVERTSSGEVSQVSILDRRWRWQFGRISGTYNARRDDFTLQQGGAETADTERTPQQLATLCLEAMGEQQFDISELPNDARPSVEWDGTVPAEALARLCDELGCRVVLQLDNRVALRRIGVGAALPAIDAMQHSPTINLPERPDEIVVVGGPNRYQVDFPLEAVGLTGDESSEGDALAPIDQLSYRPSGGWSAVDVPYFHQVDVASRNLARKSVFRCYRIKTPVAVPGYEGSNGNLVDRLEQILPIEDEQVATDNENGQVSNLPAVVFGVWHPDALDVANSALQLLPLEEQPAQGGPGSIGPVYRRGYKLDVARGLVIFDEPVYRNTHPSATGSVGFEVIISPAELVLRVACSVRDPQTLALERYQHTRSTGASGGTAPRYLSHDEILLTHKPQYGQSYTLSEVLTNTVEADEAADRYLDAAEAEYAINESHTAVYPGIFPIELDGAIRQVSFEIGGSGATTTVARNNELPHVGKSYSSMRRVERQRAMEEALAQFGPRELARSLKTNPHAKPRP